MFFNKARDLKRRAEWLASQTFVVLAIQVPKDNEKTPQSAEQFFAALHGIYRSDPPVQEHVSFEIVATKDSIVFYVFTPLHLRGFIEGQLYAQYPDLQITQVGDYTREVKLEGMHVAAAKVELTKEDVYPIKTVTGTELDPLASITAVMAGIEEGEHIWFQIVTKPVGDEWQNKGVSYVKAIRSGKKPISASSGKLGRFMVRVLQEVARPGAGVGDMGGAPKEPPKLSAPEEAALKAIEGKITKLGFETIFRLVAVSHDAITAKSRLQAMLAALKQYNTTNLNGFKGGDIKVDDPVSWQKFTVREFEEKGSVLNIEELASLYHFPSKTVETSAISWAGSKKGEAPFNLPLKELVDPKELTVLGKTDFRNISKEFGVKLDDRKRHIYVIGKSGTGKSTLLENMIIDDVIEGRGVVLVDPHGELADKVVDSIPEYRIKDAIIFDPADREFPLAFNLLESVGDDFKGMVASGFVGIFKKIFGNSWGPRLEHILRNTVLALLDYPNSTMLGIPRMLTEAAFRNQVVEQIKDVVVRDFWVNEFGAMDQKQRTEAVGPILNKVGQFLSTSTIRNIVGQPKSTIDIRQVMDEQKILIVNLSKGKIGEDNMALLGAMMVTKVQLAAMSRANVAADQRPDCFLYVDEFQNFATESFASILSEARKYNLGLTIAHQYIAQMSEEVKDAVIGNVGTLISFRIGGPDADVLVKEFEPVFDANDLLNLPKAHIYIKLLVDGIAPPAFSALTLPPKHIEQSFRDQVVEFSRQHYTRPRAEVEEMIEETAGYKQKREAENAAKAAQEILKRGEGMAIRPQPGVAPAAQAPVATSQVRVQTSPPQSTPQSGGAGGSQPVQQVQQAPVQPSPAPAVQPQPAQQVEKPVPQPIVSQPVVASQPAIQIQQPAPMQAAPVQQVVMPVHGPVTVIEQPVPQPTGQGGDQAEHGEEAVRIPKKEKPLKVMNGWVYKEVAQRGGLKWYIGEPEKEVLAKLEEKKRQKELASLSPDSTIPSEQRANITEQGQAAGEGLEMPHNAMQSSEDAAAPEQLQVGETITIE